MSAYKNKSNYVKGLTGFQIKTVLIYTIGDTTVKFLWDERNRTFKYYIPYELLIDEKLKPYIEHFKSFWLCEVLPLGEFE